MNADKFQFGFKLTSQARVAILLCVSAALLLVFVWPISAQSDDAGVMSRNAAGNSRNVTNDSSYVDIPSDSPPETFYTITYNQGTDSEGEANWHDEVDGSGEPIDDFKRTYQLNFQDIERSFPMAFSLDIKGPLPPLPDPTFTVTGAVEKDAVDGNTSKPYTAFYMTDSITDSTEVLVEDDLKTMFVGSSPNTEFYRRWSLGRVSRAEPVAITSSELIEIDDMKYGLVAPLSAGGDYLSSIDPDSDKPIYNKSLRAVYLHKPDSMKVTLSWEPASAVRVWHTPFKARSDGSTYYDGEIQNGQAFYEIDDENPIFVEIVEPQNAKLRWGIDDRYHEIELFPVDLEWISKDETNNPIDENPNEGGGKRYYPGKRLPTESQPRNLVTLKVSIPGLPGKKVDLKAFDVDDPTADSSQVNASDVDSNGDSGDDNFDDYLSTPKSGQFVLGSATSTTRKVTLDANGEAEVDFQVGMQPGNNYRVVVALEDYPGNFAQLQVNDSSADAFVNADNEPISGFTGAGAASPMLTVWRKLHIEQDSMGDLPDPLPTHDQNIFEDIVWGSASTSGQTTIDLVASIPYSGTLDEDFYRDGYAWPSGGDRASAYEVFSNSYLVGDQEITLIGSPTTAEQSTTTWNIVDDDNRGLSSENLPVLSRLNLISDSVKLKYAPAYITVIDVDTLGLNPNKIVDFDANLATVEQTYNTGSVNDAEDLSAHADDEAFWNQLVVASYQGRASNDRDPEAESSSVDAGVNVDNVFSQKYATVFLEGVRETMYPLFKSSNQDIVSTANALLVEEVAKVVAHEIGHSPEGTGGDDHNEGGLMGADYSADNFSGKTIKRFRQAESWR